MKDRIRKLRKDAGLNQTEFGSRIGLTQAAVAAYEAGIRTPISAVVVSICKEFNVSEDWIRTGEGEPYVAVSENDELAEFFNSVMSDVDGSVRRRLLAALRKLPDEGWAAIDQLARDMVEGKEKDEG